MNVELKLGSIRDLGVRHSQFVVRCSSCRARRSLLRARCSDSDNDPPSSPDVGHESGSEADETDATFAAHAGIEDSRRAVGQQGRREALGCAVVIGRQTIRVGRIAADVVKVAAEVREIVVERERFRFRPRNLGELLFLVKGDLRLRRVQVERGVPRAAIRTVETAARGVGVRECRVHDVRVADAKKQLVNADAGEQVGFAGEPIVGGRVELEQHVERLVWLGKPGEHTFVTGTASG